AHCWVSRLKEKRPMGRLLFGLATIVLLQTSLSTPAAETTAPPTNSSDAPKEEVKPPALDTGDTAWMLASTALVLLMVPGLALFYGGMVRRKNILGTMMHSMVALAIIGIQWVLFGYA